MLFTEFKNIQPFSRYACFRKSRQKRIDLTDMGSLNGPAVAPMSTDFNKNGSFGLRTYQVITYGVDPVNLKKSAKSWTP